MGISCRLLTPKANANRQKKGQALARLIRLLLKIKNSFGAVWPHHTIFQWENNLLEIHSQRKVLVCQTLFFFFFCEVVSAENKPCSHSTACHFLCKSDSLGGAHLDPCILPQGPHTQGREGGIPPARRLGRGMRRMFQEEDNKAKT